MTEKAALLAQRLIRNVEQVEMKHDRRPPLYDSVGARLGTGTAADKLGASFDCVAPGPYHFHYAQEEMFIILEGSGTLRVAGEMLPIVSGDVIFIPPGPEYPHQIINTSDAPLKYLSVSTREQPELVMYPDSGKYQAMARSADGEQVRYLQRPSTSLDYWQDEP
ncbi:TPA: cupin domain-containing protein [Serratia marcescens]|nr:cupin domain-containing protein [Serratia marcescens]HAT5001362.1 cupin domain-containing protein [Serratia marcescens]HAT5020030.1 cupin domain-containing protein [Serratia marcescens]HAT5022164.1 cupin domain-containing protein [Serratia marcescens]